MGLAELTAPSANGLSKVGLAHQLESSLRFGVRLATLAVGGDRVPGIQNYSRLVDLLSKFQASQYESGVQVLLSCSESDLAFAQAFLENVGEQDLWQQIAALDFQTDLETAASELYLLISNGGDSEVHSNLFSEYTSVLNLDGFETTVFDYLQDLAAPLLFAAESLDAPEAAAEPLEDDEDEVTSAPAPLSLVGTPGLEAGESASLQTLLWGAFFLLSLLTPLLRQLGVLGAEAALTAFDWDASDPKPKGSGKNDGGHGQPLATRDKAAGGSRSTHSAHSTSNGHSQNSHSRNSPPADQSVDPGSPKASSERGEAVGGDRVPVSPSTSQRRSNNPADQSHPTGQTVSPSAGSSVATPPLAINNSSESSQASRGPQPETQNANAQNANAQNADAQNGSGTAAIVAATPSSNVRSNSRSNSSGSLSFDSNSAGSGSPEPASPSSQRESSDFSAASVTIASAPAASREPLEATGVASSSSNSFSSHSLGTHSSLGLSVGLDIPMELATELSSDSEASASDSWEPDGRFTPTFTPGDSPEDDSLGGGSPVSDRPGPQTPPPAPGTSASPEISSPPPQSSETPIDRGDRSSSDTGAGDSPSSPGSPDPAGNAEPDISSVNPGDSTGAHTPSEAATGTALLDGPIADGPIADGLIDSNSTPPTSPLPGCFDDLPQPPPVPLPLLESPITIDFTVDGQGQALGAGTLVHDQYANLGVVLSIQSQTNLGMIFDGRNITGGDWDLAFDGNLLIISEDGNSLDPDDDAFGGIIEFEFDALTHSFQVGVLDIEEPGSYFDFYRGDQRLATVQVPGLGDNSYQQIASPEGIHFDRVVFHLNGSGGVTEFSYAPWVPEATAVSNLSPLPSLTTLF